LGLGGWTAVAAAPLVAAFALVGRSSTPVASAARDLVHIAAPAVAALAAVLWGGHPSGGHRAALGGPAARALLGRAHALGRGQAGRAVAVLVAFAAGSLAVLAGNAAAGGGFGPAAVALLALAGAWLAGAEAVREPELRLGLRAGGAVQALVPVLFVG